MADMPKGERNDGPSITPIERTAQEPGKTAVQKEDTSRSGSEPLHEENTAQEPGSTPAYKKDVRGEPLSNREILKAHHHSISRVRAFLIAIILVFASLIGASLIRNDPGPMELDSVYPLMGAVDVDVYSSLQFNFSNDLDSPSFLRAVSFEPSISGKWVFENDSAEFIPSERMRSNTTYHIVITNNLSDDEGSNLTEAQITWNCTTGHTSSRMVEPGTSAQIDFIGRMADGRIFTTSLEEVMDDDAKYPKSEVYVYASGKFARPRRFPIVVGKEDDFSYIEDAVIGKKIGDAVQVTMQAEDAFPYLDVNRVRDMPLVENVSVKENLTLNEADAVFWFNLTVGAEGWHPQWAWPVEIIAVHSDRVEIMNKPQIGNTSHLYSWETEVTGMDASNITLRHNVNNTHLNQILGIWESVPEEIFMVLAVNSTHTTIDLNFPPGMIGETIEWTFIIHDVKWVK